jgi:DNA-binding transcriptional ArsR family regulator
MSFTSDESRLTSVAALRALGHPTRLRILAHLQLSGDATATECAAEVGESASSCSYHLRLLAQHGFVEQVPTEDGRERRWHRLVTTVDFDAGAERDEEFQVASSLARAALLELSDTNVRDYLASERDFSAAWREAAAFLQTTIVASPSELVELTSRIQALLAEYAPSARERKPRGARVVHVSVRAVPKP